MSLTSIALHASHLADCDHLWPDRAAYTEAERERYRGVVATLLDGGQARGIVLLSGSRPRGVGLSLFASCAWIDRYLSDPDPLLGKQLLLATDFETGPILTRSAIAAGNKHNGLTVVVLGQGHDLTDRTRQEMPELFGALLQGFLDHHRGFRISRIVDEVLGDLNIEAIDGTRLFPPPVRLESVLLNGGPLRSALYVLTREQALAGYSPLLPVFIYNPPRIFFTAAEQELLAKALSGAPDEVLAAQLGIRVSAVKARWNRIHHRAAAVLPQMYGTGETSRPGSRGAQVRHLIVDYVRQHPSELTPNHG